MMVEQGRASWTKDGRWRLMVAVDNKGDRRSMAVGALNGSSDGQLQGSSEAAEAKRKTQTQQSNEGGGGLRTPSMLSNVQRVGGRASAGCWQWRLSRAMGVSHCQGKGGSASMGRRQQCIVVGGVSMALSDAWAVGGSVGGITSVELWWRCCWGGGGVGALAASNATTNH